MAGGLDQWLSSPPVREELIRYCMLTGQMPFLSRIATQCKNNRYLGRACIQVTTQFTDEKLGVKTLSESRAKA